MNRLSNPAWRQMAAMVCAVVVAAVAACGGGGGTTVSAPSATASSFSQGAISGFGSVIVNGVRWDDNSASIVDDDGVAHDKGDLRLGMFVDVDGADLDHDRGTGRALTIHFGSETLGPIASIDTTGSTLNVLGLTIVVTPSTVFDDSITGGLAGLAVDDVVEVFGLFDAANDRVVATRIQVRTGVTEFRLRGTVSALDTTAKTFMLGTELISYAATTDVPATLANGQQVKVRMQTTPVNGAFVANRVRPIQREVEDRHEAEIEGMVTTLTSPTSFVVGTTPVDASAATFPDGPVALGSQVEVKGTLTNGVLVATQVKLDDDRHGGPKEFELHGAVSNVDTTAKTFALRGLTVSFAGNVEFKDGSASQLVDGAQVEVKGTLAADLTIINATRIEFE